MEFVKTVLFQKYKKSVRNLATPPSGGLGPLVRLL